MTVPSVRALFYLANYTAEVREEELVDWIAAHPESKRDLLDLEASIFVTGDGQEAEVADNLVNLLEALCFDAVATVMQGGEGAFDLYTAETTVRLKPVNDQVVLESTVCDPVTFPKVAFLDALVSCGERCLGLIEQIWGNDTPRASVFTALRAKARQVREALAA